MFGMRGLTTPLIQIYLIKKDCRLRRLGLINKYDIEVRQPAQ